MEKRPFSQTRCEARDPKEKYDDGSKKIIKGEVGATRTNLWIADTEVQRSIRFHT